jgi:hypothetical protein
VGDSAEKVREFYRRQGEERERERIIKVLTFLPFIWMGDVQLIQVSKNEVINLVEGKMQ